jgi:hypothetical protein
MPRATSGIPFDRATDLRARALRARLHAITLADQEAAEKLRSYADELEDQAAALDGE